MQRHPVPHDARLKKLVLTEDAFELIGRLQVRSREFETILTADFSEEEKKELKGYLERMKSNLK